MTGPFPPLPAAGILLLVALVFLRRPLAAALRLLLRSSIGLALLAILRFVPLLPGTTLGVNIANALILGLLGVPGFGLLLMLQWVFS